MDKKITASMIIEILGRPPEHIKKTLGEILDKIKESKGVKMIESKIHEPKEMEVKEENIPEAKKIYTSFMELEADFENVEALFTTAFTYMPSHIEIIDPSELMIPNNQLSEILSGIMLRLHKYDEVTKKLAADREILVNKLKELMDEKQRKEQDKKD